MGAIVVIAIVGVIGTIVAQRDTGPAERVSPNAAPDETAALDDDVSTTTPPQPSSETVPAAEPFVLLHTLPGVSQKVEVVSATPGGTLPDLAEAEVGQVPAWTEWTIPVPAGLDTLDQPTEVIVLSSRVLHRIEFPSGRVRSVALAERWDPNAYLAVSGDTIAVTTFRDVLLLGNDRPVTRAGVGQGVDAIRARPAVGDFVVTLRRSSQVGPDQQRLLSAVGVLTDLTGTVAEAIPAWDQSILPSGELAGNRPGGAYALGIDGTARRFDDGSLVAVGANHYAVNRCDEQLQCAQFVVDARTGEATPAVLTPLEPYFYFDPSLAISPDGRFVVYPDWQQPELVWGLIDVESGDVADLVTTPESLFGYSWAADSSGVFTGWNDTLLFNDVEGRTVGISGFGRIHAVVAQPVGPPVAQPGAVVE